MTTAQRCTGVIRFENKGKGDAMNVSKHPFNHFKNSIPLILNNFFNLNTKKTYNIFGLVVII